MKAGLAVVEALRAEGVDHTFGVVGSPTSTIVTEMYGRDDIRFVEIPVAEYFPPAAPTPA